ncbi:PaaI family thioesterase [Psychrobacillus sp. NPDC096426]|uniref:PaaI family thioesterase n=1 Tax=Psychrobacillus sp. NPDC096426 TaxID=3364491 RepID=UPI0038082C68
MDLINRYEESPFWALIGLKVDSIEENSAKIKLNITPNLLNGKGILHGGVIATMLDAVMGINIKLRSSEIQLATINLTTQYIKPVKLNEVIYASAEIIQFGKNIVCIEARITNENNDHVSIGIGTFKVNIIER